MLIDISKIKAVNRIRKDFGDITELATDIQANGLINPPIVIPEKDGTYTLLAGERRLRAMKSLGYQQVEVRTWGNLTDEQKLNIEISENEVRKDFSRAERIEYARRLERIESEKARDRQAATRFGANKASQNSDSPYRSDDIVAEKMGIGSRDTYRKEKYIVDNADQLSPQDFADWDEGKLSTNKAFNKVKAECERLKEENSNYQKLLEIMPELEDLVDTGIVNKSTALALIKELSPQEQEELFTNLDIAQKYIDEIKKLKNNPLKPADYDSLKKQLQNYKSDILFIQSQYDKTLSEFQNFKKQVKNKEEETKEAQYAKKLKDSSLLFCSKVYTFIEQVGGFVWLTDEINKIPELEREGYVRAVHAIKSWADTMEYNINNKMKEITNHE